MFHRQFLKETPAVKWDVIDKSSVFSSFRYTFLRINKNISPKFGTDVAYVRVPISADAFLEPFHGREVLNCYLQSFFFMCFCEEAMRTLVCRHILIRWDNILHAQLMKFGSIYEKTVKLIRVNKIQWNCCVRHPIKICCNKPLSLKHNYIQRRLEGKGMTPFSYSGDSQYSLSVGKLSLTLRVHPIPFYLFYCFL